MRMTTLALVAVFGLAVAAPARSEQRPTDLVDRRVEARVIRVLDGDTFDARTQSGRVIRVRLFGVDSPELGEPAADQALRFARVLLFDKVVIISGHDIDRFRRLVAMVTVSGTDVSLELLTAGLACHFRQYSREPTYELAEQSARSRQVGFWAIGAPKPRCAVNGPPATSEQLTIVGNVSNRIYHRTTCKNSTCKNCSARFDSIEQAQKAGFRPARDCFR